MNNRLGVCIIGCNGAVATTVIAGVALMRKGSVPRLGMITEGPMKDLLDLAPLDNMVFGGWDLSNKNVYEAALTQGVIQHHLLDEVKEELSAIRPWPAVVSSRFLFSMAGTNIVTANSVREELAFIERDIKAFKDQHNLENVVMVNLTSTEKYAELADVYMTLEAFEKGLDSNDERISPTMKYMYVACKQQIPHVNFTPSLSNVPALEKLAVKCGVPIAGKDGKTGQTFLKTVLAPAFLLRRLKVDGWYSTNILGNNDGLVLNDPASNKTKVTSKQQVLDSMLGYKVDDHQVHIHFYRPRGDDKEAWDNIDISGFLGERMQLKIDFLCKDSILAAPLVLDLVRLMDVAKKRGERGIQRQLSMFFKSPYTTEGEQPVHDFFKQSEMLMHWVDDQAGLQGHKAP
jgi:myo-inositol-1-phosphate synthase